MQYKPRMRQYKLLTCKFNENHLSQPPDCGEILDASDANTCGSGVPEPIQRDADSNTTCGRDALNCIFIYARCDGRIHEDLRSAADRRLRHA
jgi:hypothetical protein